MNEFRHTAAAPTNASAGVLRLEGRDVLPLLHNISTRSLLELAVGEARATVFCDFRGRLLHRVAVARDRMGGVWLVRPDAPGDELAAYLDAHVFREDVRIADLSAAWDVTMRHDPTNAAGTGIEPDRDSRFGIGEACIFEMRPRASSEAALPLEETERVRLGWPRHGREIRDEFNPFEVNLGGDVDLDKGCYTGQEALMRLVTYRSVRRRLVALAGAGEPITSADVRDAAGEKIGRLTSVARERGDSDTAWSGLAVMRIESAKPSLAVGVDGADAVTIVRVFPFASPAGRPFQL